MSVMPPAQPIAYQRSFEKAEDDEADTQRGLDETMRKIQETTYRDGGRALRSVHAKSHGLLRGELVVPAGLPAGLAQGIFARPGRYPLVIRLSTIPGDILPDSVSTPRGLAIKVIGVEGERLPGSEGAVTQDFVLVNGPAFVKSDAAGFLSSLKLLAATTDKAEGAKKVISATMRGLEKVLESVGIESPTVITMGGQPETHPLGDTYYSQAPLLHGAYMAKVAARPASPALEALIRQPLDVNGKPDGLRQAVVDFFATQGGEWDLCVQLCTDLDAMPIEDAKTVWPESRSPYQPVARIVVPSQPAWSDARAAAIDDGLSFSPWHGVAAHRPLGSVMRMRRQAYEMARRFRAERNGHAIEEPRSIDDLAL